MAEIKPFRAFFYNPQKISDLSKVVCPPYDVIDSKQQDFYHSLDPYNMIHLILGKDIADEDKYKKAAEYFENWIKEQILIQDSRACIYFYVQNYNLKGENKIRSGFISLLSLAEDNRIFPHEHTHIEPKEDRLRLLEMVGANLSPIFVLFQDKHRIISRIYEQYIVDKIPFIELMDQENVSHKLWRIDDNHILDLIQKSMLDRDIFIADGHHRYEVAVTYRNRMREKYNFDKERLKDFDYIMAYFTNMESRGLTVLPVHRLVRKVDIDMDTLKKNLNQFFDLEQIKQKDKFFFYLNKAGLNQPTLGLYKNGCYFLLRLKSLGFLDKMNRDKPLRYYKLDVSILNHIVFKEVLNIEPDDRDRVIFEQDAEKLIIQSDRDDKSMVFLLNPIKIDDMVAIASSGFRLPPKTTYFYPKVLSGLLINKFS